MSGLKRPNDRYEVSPSKKRILDEETSKSSIKTPDGIQVSNARSSSQKHPNNEKPIPPSPASNSPSPNNPIGTASKQYLGCSSIEDYAFEDKLGEGTFGEVHRARHKKTKQLVALKRILMHNEKDGLPITAIREIRILKSLKHPNVIELCDMAIKPGNKALAQRASFYMVFPYMDHDLTGLLENNQVRLSISQIKLYFKQLLEGTRYLHNNKIMHRDLKASNLLIDNRGVLKIADFGLARPFLDEEKQYTSCVVTRWYRPPELLLDIKLYTCAIDMWGIGCILAEMLIGKPLLPGCSELDQLEKIFKLCGSPNEETMPGWKDYPGADKLKSFGNYKPRIKDDFRRFGPKAVEILEGLLNLNPSKRLTADAALDHDFLWTPPVVAEIGSLPHYHSSHEYDRRKPRPSHPPESRHPHPRRDRGRDFQGRHPYQQNNRR